MALGDLRERFARLHGHIGQAGERQHHRQDKSGESAAHHCGFELGAD